MNAIKRILPNLITLANLTCGLFSVIFAFDGNLPLASFYIFAGAFFDFFDGLAARLLKVSGEFGKQLDSMADMVTFGVAPGFLLFHFMFYLNNNMFFGDSMENSSLFFPSSLALLIPIFSAVRLANFNIDTRQVTSFIGLPTPVLAIFVASLPLIDKYQQLSMLSDFRFLIAISVILPLLLVAKISLFSLKFSKEESMESFLNIFRITLISASLILLFVFQFAAIPFIVILYLILSIVNNFMK